MIVLLYEVQHETKIKLHNASLSCISLMSQLRRIKDELNFFKLSQYKIDQISIKLIQYIRRRRKLKTCKNNSL